MFPAAMLTDVDALNRGKHGVDLSYGAVGLASSKGRGSVTGDGRVAKTEFSKFMDKRRMVNTPKVGEKEKEKDKGGGRRDSRLFSFNVGKKKKGASFSEDEGGSPRNHKSNKNDKTPEATSPRGRGGIYSISPPGSLCSEGQLHGDYER